MSGRRNRPRRHAAGVRRRGRKTVRFLKRHEGEIETGAKLATLLL